MQSKYQLTSRKKAPRHQQELEYNQLYLEMMS